MMRNFRMIAGAAALAVLASGAAYGQLSVNNLIGFGARPPAAGGGVPVVYQAAAAYVQPTEAAGTAPFEHSFTVSHTKDPDTTMLFVGIAEPGENDNTKYVTPGVGTSVSYCGSPMTYMTGSQVNWSTQFGDNDHFDFTWWWIRGPSNGACNLVFSVDENGVNGHSDSSLDPPFTIPFVVMEFSGAISSGDPYEGVATSNNGEATALSATLNLTATTGRMAVWGTSHDGSTTLVGAAPTVNVGTVDANSGDTTGYHINSGHYDAAGNKTITVTWGSSVTRNHEISGFHVKPNP